MHMIMIPLLALLAAPAAAQDAPADKPEIRSCIDMRAIRDTRLSKTQGYFVRAGRQWWRNTAGECPLFGNDRSVRVITVVSRQCRGDQVAVFQNFTGIEFGTCILSDWVAVAEADVPQGKRLRD